MGDNQSAPAGWYIDPQNRSQLRWWDGQKWLDHYTPAPAAPTAPAASSAASELVNEGTSTAKPALEARPSFVERALKFTADPRVRDGAISAAGAAFATGGVVSSAKDKRTPVILLLGLVAIAVGLFMLISGVGFPGIAPVEATAVGKVTKLQDKSWLDDKCIPTVEFRVGKETFTTRPDVFSECRWEVGDSVSVAYDIEAGGLDARLGKAASAIDAVSFAPLAGILVIVGLVVSAWAGTILAIRAGSILGGLALFLHGVTRTSRSR